MMPKIPFTTRFQHDSKFEELFLLHAQTLGVYTTLKRQDYEDRG